VKMLLTTLGQARKRPSLLTASSVVLLAGVGLALCSSIYSVRAAVVPVFNPRTGRLAPSLNAGSRTPSVPGTRKGRTGEPRPLSRNYIQTVWTDEQGLPQNSVNAIIQTRDGYLWLGTFGGLARFDGVKFTVLDSANTPGMKANRILSLYQDRAGVLWIGCETGEVMSLKDGQATTFAAADGLPGGVVRCFFEDQAGGMWIGTSNGLVQWQPGGIRIYSERDGVPGAYIWAIYEDRPGHLLVGTEAGLVEFSNGRGTVVDSCGAVRAICRTSRGELLLGTDKGLAVLDRSRMLPYPLFQGLPAQRMRTITEDLKGNIWIGYFESGIVSRWSAAALNNGPDAVDKLPGLVGPICIDREGDVWTGTRGGGLVRFKERRLRVFSVDDGLPSNSINAIVEDGGGGIWCDTSGGLVHVSGGDRPAITTYNTNDGLPKPFTEGLYRDRSGSMWLGCDGLVRFKDGSFTDYSAAADLIKASIHAITEDGSGNLWVGSNKGLREFHEGRFQSYQVASGLVNNDVRYILTAADGSLWFGTTGGLSHFHDGAFTNYTTDQGLPNNYVRGIVEDGGGALWIGTYGGGICRFKDGHFVQVLIKDGLFDSFISQILDDGAGRLWMLSNHGVFHISRKELNDFADGRTASITCVSYGVADGMKSAEGNGGSQPAGVKSQDGRLWFATIDGLVEIDPAQSPAMLPPAVIEGVMIDRNPAPPGGLIRIVPGKESLEVHYTGLSFTRPDQLQFKYRLIGLDEDWIDAGTRRVAYYSHIPPGHYTFSVIVSSSDGVWNQSPATLKIEVVPPFWRTWWFLSLAMLTAVGLLAIIYWRRIEHLKQARATQELFSKKLLESQEKERQRIAAELHDGLGQSLLIIKNRVFLAASSLEAPQDGQQTREQLDEITDSASRAIEEVREIAFNLRPYQLNRFGLTRTLQAIFTKFSDPGRTVFSAQIDPIDGLFTKEDEISIYRIVQEGINNIVKHSGATEATLTVKRSGRKVDFQIHDNGEGFAPVDVQSGNGSRPGFGLTGMAERVRMLGGEYSLNSSPAAGTTIIIKLEATADPDGNPDQNRHR